ncbi:MAG: ATP-binding protein [Planctomycetota bacterium]
MIYERVVISSDLKFLYLTRKIILNILRKSKLSAENENKVIIAIDEAVSNVIEHSHGFQRHKPIDLVINSNEKKIQITISNKGKCFNPRTVCKPDIMESIKEGKKRGLGVFLIRQVMDKVQYSFKNGQNKLILVKYITK